MPSHTLNLIEEAFAKAKEIMFNDYSVDIERLSKSKNDYLVFHQKHIVNRILEKFGFHLMGVNYFQRFLNLEYSNLGKYNSIGTLQYALNNPEKFDKVYNLLEDEDSKNTFDWFINFRVTYSFLGEFAFQIYPLKTTKEQFFNEMKRLEVDKKNHLLKMKDYYFASGIVGVTSSWIFEQYWLNGKCEVAKGDYVIDGGAFNGETSFWFASKGAEKIYAFEPDPINFKELSENIKRNNTQGKIIPVKTMLSDSNGNCNFYSTSSGSSVALSKGNIAVEMVTLDSFIESQRVKRVNFIKLDTEGAELEILRGSIHTIKNFKPKLAISVYHKPEDIITIPQFLKGILPEAKFYLSHKYFDWCETILFVTP
jgi:FkbM family methyltransferase